MKKLVSFVITATALVFIAIACNGGEQPLDGTSWKLIGIVDSEIGLLKELEPKDCDWCYSLTFDRDSVITIFSSANEGNGTYNLDYATYSIFISELLWTEVCEGGDGELWHDIVRKIEKFALQKEVLKLYYNANKNYLLFKSRSNGFSPWECKVSCSE